jgi:hypothetical protein
MSRHYITAAALRELEPRLTPRDLAILERVSDLHFMSGSQLARLYFADHDDQAVDARAARRALLRLTRLACLDRLPRVVGGVRAGSSGFVYCLGIAGQRLAVERGWQPERRRRRSASPGTLFLRHSLQVSELHVQLSLADRSRRIELLALEGEPACWRSYSRGSAQRMTLKPDSYVRLGVGDFEDSCFVEIDRGTEGSRALDRQLRAYLDYQASGKEQQTRGVFPKVLWTVPDERRAAVIEGCIGRLPAGSRGLFAVADFAEVLTAICGLELTHAQP